MCADFELVLFESPDDCYLSVVGYSTHRSHSVLQLFQSLAEQWVVILDDMPVEAQVLPPIETGTHPTLRRYTKRASLRALVAERWLASSEDHPGLLSITGSAHKTTRPSLEFDISFRYNGHSATNLARVPLSVYSIHINARHLVDVEATTVRALVVATFNELASVECAYGLVDMARAKDTSSGEHYDVNYGTSGIPFQQLINMALWLEHSGCPLTRTRGVFWGNFLGRTMCERLGGASKVVQEYRAFQGRTHTNEKIAEELAHHGALLCTSSHPIDCLRGDYMMLGGWSQQNGVWLHRRLRSADLLP